VKHQSTKIALVVGFMAVVVLTFLTVFVGITISNLQNKTAESTRESLLNDYDTQIKYVSESVVSSIEAVYKLSLNGEISEEEAKKVAKEIAREAVYGTSGYFWVDNLDGDLVAHHYLRDTEGSNRINLKDANGNMIIQNILALGFNGGYTEFWFPKEAGGDSFPKRAYSLGFEPYNWIISTGNYYDEIDSQIQKIKAKNDSSLHSVFVFLIIFNIIVTIVFFLFCFFMVKKLTKPLRNLEGGLNEISEGAGDLTQRMQISTNDEVGRLASSFDRFVTKLQEMISGIHVSAGKLSGLGRDMALHSEETATSVIQISANIVGVKQKIDDQAASVEETASAVAQTSQNIRSFDGMIQNQVAAVVQASAAVEELIGNVSSVDKSIDKMTEEFQKLEKNTRTGIDKQSIVNQQINQIAEESGMLIEANKIIEKIASQTNLLAMNAAIEAAHAGDAGKGFSVVADEIRKLAEDSATQSKSISTELKNIQDRIETVVNSSQESEVSFSMVSEGIESTDTLVHQIKSAMDEQQEGSKQILESLGAMNNSSSEVKNASTEMAEGNKSILEAMKLLQESSLAIKELMQQMEEGTENIKNASTRLKDISQEVNISILGIGKEIDLFKV
jgi:methyl-accepting chemotaxis protein